MAEKWFNITLDEKGNTKTVEGRLVRGNRIRVLTEGRKHILEVYIRDHYHFEQKWINQMQWVLVL